jgi:hypothetical protein
MEALAVLLVVAVFALVVFAFVRMTIGHGVLTARVHDIFRRASRPPPPDGPCPHCGAPIPAAEGDADSRCAHCGQLFRPRR